MLRLSAALLFLSFLAASPAFARARCDAMEPGIRFHVEIGVGEYDIETQERLDLMLLKKAGIVARTARRTTDGCIEAWIPNGDGHFRTEYYSPSQLDRMIDAKDGLSLDPDDFKDPTGPGVLFNLRIK